MSTPDNLTSYRVVILPVLFLGRHFHNDFDQEKEGKRAREHLIIIAGAPPPSLLSPVVDSCIGLSPFRLQMALLAQGFKPQPNTKRALSARMI